MPGFEAGGYGEESGDSGDTGLGDSHPDMALLFQNQKQFYNNLIVSLYEHNNRSNVVIT